MVLFRVGNCPDRALGEWEQSNNTGDHGGVRSWGHGGDNRQMGVHLRQHAPKRVNLLILARVVIPEIELRVPIRRLVLGDAARGAVSRLKLIVERGYTKSYSHELVWGQVTSLCGI